MFQFAYFLCRPISLVAGLRCSQGEEQGQGLRPQEVCLGPQQGEVHDIKRLNNFITPHYYILNPLDVMIKTREANA
jgi:hypothetical protein